MRTSTRILTTCLLAACAAGALGLGSEDRPENAEGEELPAECPCVLVADWGVGNETAGELWQAFAHDPTRFGSPVVCTDDGTSIKIIVDAIEAETVGAGVNGVDNQCDVYHGDGTAPALSRSELAAGEAAACRVLLQDEGLACAP